MAQLLRFPGRQGHPDVLVNPQYVSCVAHSTFHDAGSVAIYIAGVTYPIIVEGEVLAVGARIQQAMEE